MNENANSKKNLRRLLLQPFFSSPTVILSFLLLVLATVACLEVVLRISQRPQDTGIKRRDLLTIEARVALPVPTIDIPGPHLSVRRRTVRRDISHKRIRRQSPSAQSTTPTPLTTEPVATTPRSSSILTTPTPTTAPNDSTPDDSEFPNSSPTEVTTTHPSDSDPTSIYDGGNGSPIGSTTPIETSTTIYDGGNESPVESPIPTTTTIIDAENESPIGSTVPVQETTLAASSPMPESPLDSPTPSRSSTSPTTTTANYGSTSSSSSTSSFFRTTTPISSSNPATTTTRPRDSDPTTAQSADTDPTPTTRPRDSDSGTTTVLVITTSSISTAEPTQSLGSDTEEIPDGPTPLETSPEVEVTTIDDGETPVVTQTPTVTRDDNPEITGIATTSNQEGPPSTVISTTATEAEGPTLTEASTTIEEEGPATIGEPASTAESTISPTITATNDDEVEATSLATATETGDVTSTGTANNDPESPETSSTEAVLIPVATDTANPDGDNPDGSDGNVVESADGSLVDEDSDDDADTSSPTPSDSILSTDRSSVLAPLNVVTIASDAAVSANIGYTIVSDTVSTGDLGASQTGLTQRLSATNSAGIQASIASLTGDVQASATRTGLPNVAHSVTALVETTGNVQSTQPALLTNPNSGSNTDPGTIVAISTGQMSPSATAGSEVGGPGTDGSDTAGNAYAVAQLTGGLQALFAERHDPIPFPDGYNIVPTIVNTLVEFVAAYAPILIAVFFQTFWLIIFASIKLNEPFHQLAQPGGTPPTTGMMFELLATGFPIDHFRQGFMGNWSSVYMIAGYLVLLMLLIVPSLATEAFSVQNVRGKCIYDASRTGCVEKVWTIALKPVRTLQAALVVVAVLVLMVLILRLYRGNRLNFKKVSMAIIADTLTDPSSVNLLRRVQPNMDRNNIHHVLSHHLWGLEPSIATELGTGEAHYVLRTKKQRTPTKMEGAFDKVGKAWEKISPYHLHLDLLFPTVFIVFLMVVISIYASNSINDSKLTIFFKSVSFGPKFFLVSTVTVLGIAFCRVEYEVRIMTVYRSLYLAVEPHELLQRRLHGSPLTQAFASLWHCEWVCFYMSFMAGYGTQILSIVIGNVPWHAGQSPTSAKACIFISLTILILMFAALGTVWGWRQGNHTLGLTQLPGTLAEIYTLMVHDRVPGITIPRSAAETEIDGKGFFGKEVEWNKQANQEVTEIKDTEDKGPEVIESDIMMEELKEK